MRPLDKGNIPKDGENEKTVTNYKNWRKDLIDRIGNYCSYCNMSLKENLQVEHIVAQNINPALSLDWDNMLLACGACNRKKSDNPCSTNTHYLPHAHNTQMAFRFYSAPNNRQNNVISTFVAWKGTPALQQKAEATISLCGLNIDTTQTSSQVTDLRWKYRRDALMCAIIWKSNWLRWGKTMHRDFINLLITVIEGKGFWSIWFDIFIQEPLIREALVLRFPGTARNCFDANFCPIPRNPTNIADTL